MAVELASPFLLAEALHRRPCHVTVAVGSAASAALLPAPATARPRWLAVFAVIRSCRAFLTVAENRVTDVLHRRPSYVALDIRAGDEQGAAIIAVPDDLEAKLSLVEHGRLVEVVKGKSVDGLRGLGGVEEIAASLASNTESGIDVGEGDSRLLLRRKLFGSNTYKKPPARGFMSFVYWKAFKDPMLFILLAPTLVLSLVSEIKEHGVEKGWKYGLVNICSTLAIICVSVVLVGPVINFLQARRFKKLPHECGIVRVIRDGRRQEVSIFDVVVGDVVCLQIGDQVPADGLFLDGHSLQVDESSMTGESDYVAVDARRNPFLTPGTKIADGYARMLVTSVGMDTAGGEKMSSISHDADEPTPLQERLEKLTYSIGKIGMAVAALALVVLLVRHFTGSTKFDKNEVSFKSVVIALVSIVSDAVTIAVVGVPEVLPLAVTLTLAYSMKRVMADKAVVRKLPACETMGSVTTICTDKTGTLTQNQMQVTKFWIGEEEVVGDKSSTTIVNDRLLELLHQGVGLNTTATVYKSSSSASEPEFSGSPTEKAILSWAVKELGMDAEAQKRRWEILHVEAFNSDKKRSGVMARSKEGEHVINVHWKGAAEMILGMCSHYCNTDGVPRELDAEKRTMAEQIIEGMAASSLRCIAFAYKRQGSVENYCSGNDGDGDGEDGVRKLEEEKLTLLGLVGLKDPCRPGARKAVEACRAAGVAVKMITGDNIFTAKSIAFECGILRADDGDGDGAVVEGKTFRSWSKERQMEMVDRIRVMARSSPSDKLLMVRCLKKKHHVVAVTGDGTSDAPALREADVGLSMGVQCTELAMESSDIVILDGNFASVDTVLMSGRCVYNNIQKVIQFQLINFVAALVINFAAVVSSDKVPLTTVELRIWPFYANSHLIMEILGVLALATEKPTEDLAKKPPVGRTAPLITNVMWRNLLAQALFQVPVLLVLQFRGESMSGVGEKVKNTLVFNTFVLCQVFNQFNARRLEKKNVFEGIHKNRLFLGFIAATLIFQVLMVEFMIKRFEDAERLDWGQWGFCVGVAFLSWPIDWAFKYWVPVGDEPTSVTTQGAEQGAFRRARVDLEEIFSIFQDSSVLL